MDGTLNNLHTCRMRMGTKIAFTQRMESGSLRVKGIGWKPMPTCCINLPSGTKDYLLVGFPSPAGSRDATGMHRFECSPVNLWNSALLRTRGRPVCSFLTACRWGNHDLDQAGCRLGLRVRIFSERPFSIGADVEGIIEHSEKSLYYKRSHFSFKRSRNPILN